MSWNPLIFNGENVNEINLNLTLQCGQTFRWKYIEGEWRCGFDNFIVRLKQNSDFSVYYFATDNLRMQLEIFLTDYFRCNESLTNLFNNWKYVDNCFQETFNNFKGLRLLRQCPVENLFSFICSSNNNISRISKLVCTLAENFGVQHYLFEEDGRKCFYPSFPSINDLCIENLEESLGILGFGYRASYIKNTALTLKQAGGKDHLLTLRSESYNDAKSFLLSLAGVGLKVADCVLLGSLDKMNAVPIDVHMFNVLKKYYPHQMSSNIMASKSVTKSNYLTLQNIFNSIWTPQPGWAQLIIFASDLKASRFEGESKGTTRKNKG